MNEEILPKATHTGELKIGDLIIPCAVLDDGTRLISERGMTKALGGKRGGSHWVRKRAGGEGADLPVFASAMNLRPYINEELAVALMAPRKYLSKTGRKVGHGREGALLPQVCEVWLKARDAGALLPSQVHIAKQAEILLRGFAHVGIIALIDEATGYQAERDREELHKILAAYINKELLPWTKRFPDEFYKHLFRLMRWQYSPMSIKRPQYVGKLTNKLIYDQLPPGVLDELRARNPKNAKGRRKHKFFQFLTEDIGDPHLQKQIVKVLTLMQISRNLRAFKTFFAQAHRKEGEPEQTDAFSEIEEDDYDES